MPTFDFSCTACATVFEQTIPYGSTVLPPCPDCGSQDITKLLSPPAGIIFKGSGFYKTDGANKETAPSKETEAPKEGKKTDAAPPVTAPATPSSPSSHTPQESK